MINHHKELPDNLFQQWNCIDSTYRRALIVVLFINFLAFGQELVCFTMIWDDYNQIIWHKAGKWLNQGRWFLDVIYFWVLGGWYSPFFHTLLGIIISTITALYICYLWNITKLEEIVLVSAVISICPLMSDIYEWETNKVAIPIANFFSVLAVYITKKSNSRAILISSLLIMFSLATYQTAIHFAIETTIFISLFEILFNINSNNLYLNLKETLWPRLIAISLGGLLYIISLNLVSQYQPELRSDRYGSLISSLWELRIKIDKQIDQIISLLFKSHDLFPSLLQLITGLLLFIAINNLIITIFTKKASIIYRILNTFAALSVFIIALFSYQIIFFPSKEILESYRTLASFSIVIGATVAISLIFSTSVLQKNFVFVVSSLLIFGFIVENNVEYSRRYFINLHDWHLANRILMRVENHPDFARALPKRQIAMIGLPSFLGNKNIFMQSSISPYLEPPATLDIAAVDVILSYYFESYDVLRVVPWRLESKKLIPDSAIEYACNHHAWPHVDSVTVLNDGLIVISFLNTNSYNKICNL